MRKLSILIGLITLLAGCASGDGPTSGSGPSAAGAASGVTRGLNPRIARGGPRLQCVPYARRVAGIPIRGDAWTWWQQAAGKYRRDRRPAVGAVLAFSRTRRLRLGHLSVVTAVRSPREIVVTHANWLNRERIHYDVPVRDVSKANDWSAVRVWYTPGKVWGKSVYATRGFIHPARKRPTPRRRAS